MEASCVKSGKSLVFGVSETDFAGCSEKEILIGLVFFANRFCGKV